MEEFLMHLAGIPSEMIDEIEKDEPSAAALIRIAQQAQPLLAEAMPLFKALMPLYAQALPLLVKLQPLLTSGEPLVEQAVKNMSAILPAVADVAAFIEKKKKADQATVSQTGEYTPNVGA